MTQEAHKPTPATRKTAKSLSGLGVPQSDICVILGITKPTLHKHYREELDVGLAEANAKVAQSLFKQATTGNTAAAIFWMKARANWSEKIVQEISGPDGAPIKTEHDLAAGLAYTLRKGLGVA